MFIANAFSLQMIDTAEAVSVNINPISKEEIPMAVSSAIGHKDTAEVVSSILNRKIEHNRVNISLKSGDELIVAQITGGRLPEGATTLPEGFKIKFLKVEIK